MAPESKPGEQSRENRSLHIQRRGYPVSFVEHYAQRGLLQQETNRFGNKLQKPEPDRERKQLRLIVLCDVHVAHNVQKDRSVFDPHLVAGLFCELFCLRGRFVSVSATEDR